MQTQVSVNYMNTLKQNVTQQAQARLIAEWNYNRFAGPAAVINTGQTYPDSDEFPLDSIVSPNRPRKQGLAKARARNRNTYNVTGTAQGFAQAAYDDAKTAPGTRAYTVSSVSKFKYWTSPTISSATGSGGIYTIDSGSLEVTYTKDIWMNRLHAVFEASVVQPKNITIFYKTTAAGAWTQWAGTYQVDANGLLSLYRQNDGSMATTEYLLNPIKIRGIKIVVAAVSAPQAHLDVIEVSARLRTDLSSFIMDYSNDFTMSETSLVTPLGICSSNEGSVTLDNTDGRFDNDRATLIGGNIENLFYGIIDKNVHMTMDLGLMVNGAYEYTRAFTMWTDEWGSQNQETVSVSVKDSSKFPQEVKPNATLYQNLTTAGIVWRMCDAIGFNNYNISTAAMNDNHIIDFYWTDPEKTVWEHFQDIAQATQTAIYFDEFDVLQVMPRRAAYDLSKSVSWTFDGEEVGTGAVAQGRPASDNNKLSDIIELEQTYDFEANTANVKYIPTSISQPVGNVIPMEEVWTPEDDVVLRSSRLVQTMPANGTSFRITPTEAKVWPYTGTIQVEGEFIKYTSKGYTYRNASNAWVSVYVGSEEERLKRDAENPLQNSLNYFNGYFYCGTTGRGQYGTTAVAHTVDLSGWTDNKYRKQGGSVVSWNGGVSLDTNVGALKMQTNKTFTPNTWYTALRGSILDLPPYWYGTRVRFPSTGNTYGAAGIAMSVGSLGAGFYCELVRTDKITANDRNLYTNEIVFYVKYNNGTIKRIGPNGGKGMPFNIAPDVWYDLDVHFEWQGSNYLVTVMVNGLTYIVATVLSSQNTGESIGGRYGLFTRGDTCAEFEYFYASTYGTNEGFGDNNAWFDRIDGGYQSSQYDREWTYNYKTGLHWKVGRPSYKVYSRYNSRMMAEFGPVVHEIREYDVKFEKTPVIHSTLYLSNDKQLICPDYNGNPFGAKFVLANTARVNAIANGEDTLTFGADNPVTQKMLIYGRLVNKGDEQTVTVKNDAAIYRRGTVEVDIASDWIQTATAANEIATWITQNWGGGSSEVKIKSFGNPVVQLGDLVAIQHPDKSMTYATHKYFVVGISQSFDGGLDTEFTLRRAKL